MIAYVIYIVLVQKLAITTLVLKFFGVTIDGGVEIII